MEKEKLDRVSELTKSRGFQSQQPIPLDLLKNFFEAYSLISSKNHSKLPESIKQKLLLLSNGIFNSDLLISQLNNKDIPLEIKEFFLIKKGSLPKENDSEINKEPISEDFSNLMNLTLETKLDLYVKTSLPIIPELQNLISSPNTKKGFLQIKYSGTLKSWNNRFMILDCNKKALLIFKEKKSLNPEKELKLEGYAIRWVGPTKSKFCFSLLAQNIKPKAVLLGGEQENWVKEWYEDIKIVMNPQENSNSNQPVQRAESVSDEENNDDLNEIVEEGFRSDIDTNRVKNKHKNKPNSDNDDYSDPEISSPFNHYTIKKANTHQDNNRKFQTPKSTLNPIEVLGNEEENDKKLNNNSSREFFGSIINKENENRELGQIFQSEILKSQNNYFKPIKESEEEVPETMDSYEIEDLRAMKTKYPPLIESLLAKTNIKELTKEVGFHLIHSGGNMRLLQYDTEPHTFKVFSILHYDILTILNCFLEPNNYRNWNNTISEHKVVQIIEGLSSVIVQEKRDYKLTLYKTREFYFSRTIIPLKDMTQFIILDKSIPKPNENTHGFWEIPGNLNFNIMTILPHKNNPKCHLLILWTQVDNQGILLTNNQNKELTIKYLSQFENLETFLAQRSFFANNSKQEIFGRYMFLKAALSRASMNEKHKSSIDIQPDNSESKIIEKKMQDFELLFERIEDPPVKRTSKKKSSFIEDKASVIKENTKEQEEHKSSIIIRKTAPLGLQSSDQLLELLNSNQHIIQILKHHYRIAPEHMTHDNIRYQPIDKETGHYAISNDWSRAKEGGLLWYNKKELEVQGKVLSYLIKRLGSNLIQGKSVINISLPVDLFDIKSFLERIAFSYTYAPYFLEPFPSNLDPKSSDFDRPGLYQIYQVLCFILSSLHMSISQKKPFNPILGETFQGWIKGCPIYCEQISHHPPISSFLMLGHKFKIQGNFEIAASMHPNSVTGKQLGLGQVIFYDILNEGNKSIYFTFPPCVVAGLAFGSRIVNYEGKVWIFDAKEKLAMEIGFNPDKKGMISGMLSKQKTANDYYRGVAYEMKESGIEKMMKGILNKKFSGINVKEDIVPGEVSLCEGIWHEYLEIKGKRYWDFKDYQAYQLEYEERPLPSDCLYREDLIVWRSNNIDEAQKKKEKLEVFQRNDKKLREKFRGKKH